MYEQFYTHKFDNLQEDVPISWKTQITKKTQRELNHLNRSVAIKETDESIGRNKTAFVHRWHACFYRKNPKESLTQKKQKKT